MVRRMYETGGILDWKGDNCSLRQVVFTRLKEKKSDRAEQVWKLGKFIWERLGS